LEFWRIAMKPGKPLAFGRIGETLFFGLPGNPVSAMVTFELFARPALRKMAGFPDNALTRPLIPVRLAEAIPHAPPRREYVRASLTLEQGEFVATTTGEQASSRLGSMAGANALILIPEESAGMEAGERAQALLLSLG
jgi:molybdopterin biosynthesis enzyme